MATKQDKVSKYTFMKNATSMPKFEDHGSQT